MVEVAAGFQVIDGAEQVISLLNGFVTLGDNAVVRRSANSLVGVLVDREHQRTSALDHEIDDAKL